MILDYIGKTTARSEVKIDWVLQQFGLPVSTYYRWRKKEAAGTLEDTVRIPVNLDAPLPWEKQAVIDYALLYPREGYRRLAYMMVDEDVVYLSPSTVYRILSSEDLLFRYKRSSKSSGRYNFVAKAPHEQWHLDIMYLWVGNRWYFFVGVLDAYSRYIVHWELLEKASALDVKAVLHTALKKYPKADPRIVTDNGPQFISREFRRLLKEFALKDIKIKIHHPESNGKIERFHRSLREEGLSERELKDKYQALDIIEEWVQHYNNKRLHSSLGYLRPVDYLTGRQKELRQLRQQKLDEATQKRKEQNRKYYLEKGNVKDQTVGALPPHPQDLPL